MYPFCPHGQGIAACSPARADWALLDTHVSHHMCWPWDLDLWMELNNGRTLTLLTLAACRLAVRTGMDTALKAKGWGMTVAGSTIRYRRRVTVFSQADDAHALHRLGRRGFSTWSSRCGGARNAPRMC